MRMEENASELYKQDLKETFKSCLAGYVMKVF